MFDFGSSDTEGDRPKGPQGAGVGVAADDRDPRIDLAGALVMLFEAKPLT